MKYTSDDNRSMQLNDNNERYYSSRGIDEDDMDDNGYETLVKANAVGGCLWIDEDGSIIDAPRRRPTDGDGRWEYERMKKLHPIFMSAIYAEESYEAYKDGYNEYRRLKRWLRKNNSDLHNQLYWE